jgi:L-aminopeptidase/D-esterase-like protein
MNAFFVKPEHVRKALENAESGSLKEGNVGGGTGMLCYEFKGGTGTSSRKLPESMGGWTVGVLVQTNFGRRFQLTVAGVPVGKHLKDGTVWTNGENPFVQDSGSLIIIVATMRRYPINSRLAKRTLAWLASATRRQRQRRYLLAFPTANMGAARR